MGAKPITAAQVAEKVLHETLFILDVRNESDYNDWRIEGDRVQSVNQPYFELLDGVEEVIGLLPRGSDVLVVCAKEGSSRFVAEQLTAAGRDSVYYLQGGMKAWSEYVKPVEVGELRGGGKIFQFNRIGKGCLSYVIVSGEEAVVVDPARMIHVYEHFAQAHNVTIKHVIDTHLHADHVSGGRVLADQVNATYWLPAKDAAGVSFAYRALEEGRDITIGHAAVNVQPLSTPGHTAGSMSLIVDRRYLLSGDTLFVASIGRPDLAGKADEWVNDLRSTLYSRYPKLSSELIVLPAHFSKMSEIDANGIVQAKLEELYTHNAGLNINNEEQFRTTVTKHLPPQPNAYREIRQVNLGVLNAEEEQLTEMEIGPNRCAVHD